jgi:Tfp pilus assembly pilus retraction ATPase PilT
MITLNQCLADLVRRNLISTEEAMVRSTDPEELANLFQKYGIRQPARGAARGG